MLCWLEPLSANCGHSKSPIFSLDMLVKTSITMCLVVACGPIFAQADKAVLCFPGQQDCLDRGGLAAEDIWKRANNPDEVESVLMAYADYTGRVSEVDMPSKGGKIVRIGRFVGSANCVRDTYFLYQDGIYRLIDSPSLEVLSAEAGNCGDVAVALKAIGEPLLVTSFFGVVTAYRFGEDFALKKVCSKRYQVSKHAVPLR